MKITKHIDEAIKEYLELRKQYEELWSEAFDMCETHYEKKETAPNFAEWVEEHNRLSNLKDYYDMTIKEIDVALQSLRSLKNIKNHIEIYQKRVDKLNEM